MRSRAEPGEELIILPEAELDIVDWYEERELGLGEEFLRCVDACIQYILRHPEAYQMIYEEYRRARRFPYGIFYRYSEEIVMVYAIFHSSGDPQKWRNRLL